MTGKMRRGKGEESLRGRRKTSKGAAMSESAPGQERIGVVSFGSLLKQHRRDAWLTQEELSERSGLSVRTIRGLERGEGHNPRPDTVDLLAHALNLSEEDHHLLVATARRRGVVTSSAATSLFSLPSPPTPIVGREEELTEVKNLIDGRETRLLTLRGTGGVGKTRLAVQAAREVANHFPDGVVFVALAYLGDPAFVIPTVARSLGLRESEGQNARETLNAYLREKRLLLVLDNFEHLLGAASEVADLVACSPELFVMVTSRATLRVRGEQEYLVPPLKLHRSASTPAAEKVASSPSGRLFVERARAASPAFELGEENAEQIAAICWQLAGLPLALELAAARVRFLSPSVLLSRLDRALSTGWARDLPERQRTLRATLNWSHDLLSEPERALFRRLSVLAGGFTLEAAEAVGASGDVIAEEVMELLGNLVEQSLVVAEGGARYWMLEPVRQYARERLEESGESRVASHSHATFFFTLAERAYPELRGPEQVEWLDLLDQEYGNLRAAMSWAISTDETEIAVRLGWALWVFWWLRGHKQEARQWMEALLEHNLPASLRTIALAVVGQLGYTQGDYESGERYLRESLRLARETNDTVRVAHAAYVLGLLALRNQDLQTARSRLEEALSLFRHLNNAPEASTVSTHLGTLLLIQGELGRAAAAMEEGLGLARKLGDRLGISNGLYCLAQVAQAGGDHDLAARRLKEGVILSEEMRDQSNLGYFVEGLAVVAGVQGEAERSARLFGAAEGLLRAVEAPVYDYYEPIRSFYERTEATVRSRLGEEAFERAAVEGQAMDFDQAVEYALDGDETQPTASS
jgi:predicted ATPase/DNA-binding XRE family transcriptional regulator